MTKIKICGLFREEDIEAANLYRPDYVGFIINYPKSHRNINIKSLEVLSKKLDSSIKRVAVFVNEDMEFIKKLFDKGLFDIIQLHGEEDNKYIQSLKISTKADIIKAHKIEDKSSLDKINFCASDLVLIDTGKGGGLSHSIKNIELLKKLNRRYMLAGGIEEANVRYFLKELSPYALDISSGAETDRKKDRAKIKRLIEMIRKEECNE